MSRHAAFDRDDLRAELETLPAFVGEMTQDLDPEALRAAMQARDGAAVLALLDQAVTTYVTSLVANAMAAQGCDSEAEALAYLVRQYA